MSKVEILYFTNASCSVCYVLKPKIETMVEAEFPQFTMRSIDTEMEPVIAAQHMVFTVPVILITADGREWDRFIRVFSVETVRQRLRRLAELMQ